MILNFHGWGDAWLTPCNLVSGSRFTVVGIVTSAVHPINRGSIPGRNNIAIFSKTRRPALEPTQPPVQWVAGGKSARSWKLITPISFYS